MRYLIIIAFILISYVGNSQCNPSIPNNTEIVNSTATGNNSGIPYWVCEGNVHITKNNNTIYLETGTSITSNKCCQTVYVPAGATVNLTQCCNTIYYVNAADLVSIGASSTTIQCSPLTYDLTNAPSGGCNTLPVELLYFKGENFQNKNLITWGTATEINNDCFILHRSLDGIDFFVLGIIKGAGNSSVISYYSMLDNEPYGDVTYYKLNQVDYDGNTTSFDIISVHSLNESKPKLVKITNLLGQEIKDSCDCVKICYFSDGSIIKKYTLK